MEVFCFRLNGRESINNHKRKWAGPKSSRARENKQKCTGSRFPVRKGSHPTTATHWIGLGQNERRRGDGDKICHTLVCSWETARTAARGSSKAASTSHDQPSSSGRSADARLPPAPPPTSPSRAATAAAGQLNTSRVSGSKCATQPGTSLQAPTISSSRLLFCGKKIGSLLRLLLALFRYPFPFSIPR